MKSIYLNAGKTQDVFNDLKDNFEGTLTYNNNEYNLEFGSSLAKGNIKGMTFPDGMTYLQFDMIFYQDVRLSMETLKNTLPIYFAYCSEGAIQHSFGEQGDRKIIKKQHSGVLKSGTGVNSILYFEKSVPIKFYVIETATNFAKEQNYELVKKLKNTFFNTKKDYLELSLQSVEITQKIQELNGMDSKGKFRNLMINRIMEKIIELEIEQQTDGFSVMANTINSFVSKQINDVKRVSSFVSDLYLQLLTTDYLIQKAGFYANILKSDFRKTYSRLVQELLIFMRIERGRI